MGRVGGHLYDRQRCSYKFQSVIPYSDYVKCFMDGWFVISFIHVPAKNKKTLKPLLEASGGKCKGTHLR